ncbi:T9SS type A sorting domain-containing protein [Wenyingzhuangia sp. IMCC45533]
MRAIKGLTLFTLLFFAKQANSQRINFFNPPKELSIIYTTDENKTLGDVYNQVQQELLNSIGGDIFLPKADELKVDIVEEEPELPVFIYTTPFSTDSPLSGDTKIVSGTTYFAQLNPSALPFLVPFAPLVPVTITEIGDEEIEFSNDFEGKLSDFEEQFNTQLGFELKWYDNPFESPFETEVDDDTVVEDKDTYFLAQVKNEVIRNTLENEQEGAIKSFKFFLANEDRRDEQGFLFTLVEVLNDDTLEKEYKIYRQNYFVNERLSGPIPLPSKANKTKNIVIDGEEDDDDFDNEAILMYSTSNKIYDFEITRAHRLYVLEDFSGFIEDLDDDEEDLATLSAKSTVDFVDDENYERAIKEVYYDEEDGSESTTLFVNFGITEIALLSPTIGFDRLYFVRKNVEHDVVIPAKANFSSDSEPSEDPSINYALFSGFVDDGDLISIDEEIPFSENKISKIKTDNLGNVYFINNDKSLVGIESFPLELDFSSVISSPSEDDSPSAFATTFISFEDIDFGGTNIKDFTVNNDFPRPFGGDVFLTKQSKANFTNSLPSFNILITPDNEDLEDDLEIGEGELVRSVNVEEPLGGIAAILKVEPSPFIFDGPVFKVNNDGDEEDDLDEEDEDDISIPFSGLMRGYTVALFGEDAADDEIYLLFNVQDITLDPNGDLFVLDSDVFDLFDVDREEELLTKANNDVFEPMAPASITMLEENSVESNRVSVTFVESSTLSNEVLFATNKVSAYPNPAINSIKINLLAANGTVQIYSLDGTLVKSITNYVDNTSIDVSSLTPGMYVLSIEAKNKLTTQKLIIQ